MKPRSLFSTTALLALPGILWQAFEMYGLTLGGRQMLFFSITHTMPAALLLVLLALPLSVALLGQASFALFKPSYRARIGISQGPLTLLAAFLSTHLLLLVFYDRWSNSNSVRVVVCVLSIVLLVAAVVITLVSLGSHFVGEQPHRAH